MADDRRRAALGVRSRYFSSKLDREFRGLEWITRMIRAFRLLLVLIVAKVGGKGKIPKRVRDDKVVGTTIYRYIHAVLMRRVCENPETILKQVQHRVREDSWERY